MNKLSPHQRGLAMTVVGVLILTPDALVVRLIETDHWTLLFWRSLAAGICLFAMNGLIEKTNPFTAIGHLFRNGLFCGLMFAGSNACFVLSVTHTAAANTLVILAAMPFIAAVLTVLVARKNLPFRTWTTIVFAMAGILTVFWGRFGSGHIFGDVLAFFCAAFMAVTLVNISVNPKINSLAAVGFGSFLAALFALIMGADPALPSPRNIVFLALNGIIIIPIAMALITYGPKLISAPEVSLIMLLETVLGPVWVWLVLSEQPLRQTFIGGALVVTAIVVNAWLGFRSNRPKVSA
jgi:drug/metabolite transporter (DMT)-like permease